MTSKFTKKASKGRPAALSRSIGSVAKKRSQAHQQGYKGQKADLEQLFERAPEAIALLDATGKVLRLNREFTRLFGYSQEEALDKDIDELVTPEDQRRRSSKVDKSACKHSAAARTGPWSMSPVVMR